MLRGDPAEIRIDSSPYPHVTIEEALCDYSSLETEFPGPEQFGPHIRSHGDLTYPDEPYLALIDKSAAYGRLHSWVYSATFCRLFLDLFSMQIAGHVASGALLLDPATLQIRPQPYEGRSMLGRNRPGAGEAFLFPRFDLGIGRKDYGRVNGGRGVHVDNATRLVSILVYVGDNRSMVGGEHRLYGLDGYEPVLAKVYRPRPNLMIASLQSNSALHDVNPVTEIVGCRRAFYMAVSCSTPIWNPARDRRLARLTANRYQKSPFERLADRIRRIK